MQTITFLTLIALNAIAWFVPIYFYRGYYRTFVAACCLIFSGSYWTLLVVLVLGIREIPLNIYEYNIVDSQLYSVVSAIAFHFGLFMLSVKQSRVSAFSSIFDNNPINQVSRFAGIAVIIRIVLVISVPYCIYLATYDVGAYSRREFFDIARPFWSTTLLPINAVLLAFLLTYDATTGKRNLSLWFYLTYILTLIHVFNVGFDGGRRDALLPLIALLLPYLLSRVYRQKETVRRDKKLLKFAVFLGLLSLALSYNRNFDVGWQMFFVEPYSFADHVATMISNLLAPMSTIHVNTQMIDFNDSYGDQGYWNYLKAIGNTLIPRFAVGYYVFDVPLVTELHRTLNWRGQDFGFMAESIYSGGLFGVVIMHFSFGVLLAWLLNGVFHSKKYALAFLVAILVAMLNSLRSDFMNFAKTFLYIGIVLSLLMYFIGKLKNANFERS